VKQPPAAHFSDEGGVYALKSSSKSTPMSLPSVRARRFGLFGASVPSGFSPAAAAFGYEVYSIRSMSGGRFRADPWPSPVSARLTRAFRAMVAAGSHFGSPLGELTPNDSKPIRLLVNRKRTIAGGRATSM